MKFRTAKRYRAGSLARAGGAQIIFKKVNIFMEARTGSSAPRLQVYQEENHEKPKQNKSRHKIQQDRNTLMIIKPSPFFEGSKTPGRNPKPGPYRAVLKRFYPSRTWKGRKGFKTKWELISDPYNTFEITNSCAFENITYFLKTISKWTSVEQLGYIGQMPDLTNLLNQSADVRVKKFSSGVPYISEINPPETLLEKVNDFTYNKIQPEQLELF